MTLETPTDKRKRRTHTAVLDAAEVLFLRDGYRGTTIEMLAGAADVAVSSIYSNFRDGKADVYAALAWRTATRHADEMNSLAEESQSQEVVAEAVDRYVEFHRKNPLALRLLGLYDVDRTDSGLVAQAKIRIDGLLLELIGVVTRSVRVAGSDVDPHALVLNGWAAMNGAISLRQRHIVDDKTLRAMLAITRTDLLGHLSRSSSATR